MKVISLSQRKFKELTPLELPKEIYNTEAKMFNFRYKGKDAILKKLYLQSGQIFANKLYTIEMLDSNKSYLPNYYFIPNYLISVGGVVEGFIIPKAEGITLSILLNDKNLDPTISLFYLKKIGEILNQLKYIRKTTPLKDFYINDLHASNFIANMDKEELYIVDLDSCKIGANLVYPSRYLTQHALLNNAKGKYNIIDNESPLGNVVVDENTDIYCYIIMILNYLYGCNVNNFSIDEFYNYLNYLEYIGINRELIEIFNRIIINCDNENPMNLLDSITNEQVYRAKQIVYKRVV